jgi:hypothetical protein
MSLNLTNIFRLERPKRRAWPDRFVRGVVLVDAATILLARAVGRTVLNGLAAYAESECAHHLALRARKAVGDVEKASLRKIDL